MPETKSSFPKAFDSPGRGGLVDSSIDSALNAIEKKIGLEGSEDPNSLEYKITHVVGGPGGAAWGGITGTLGNQTDLKSALDGKAASDDARLSDARTPTTHTHMPADVNGTAVITTDGRLSDARTPLTHTHGYEPANANIQTHVTSPHAPANAQKNSDITKAEIEAKLTGEIASHTHAAGPGGSQMPIGSIYENALVATNPSEAAMLGYGTWASLGTGRVLVAIDPGDTDFDTLGETGGAKTHTHAGHSNHAFTQPGAHSNHVVGQPTQAADTFGTTKMTTSGSGTAAFTSETARGAITGTTVDAHSAHSGGAVDAHSAHDSPDNLMPYIVVYRWVRTA